MLPFLVHFLSLLIFLVNKSSAYTSYAYYEAPVEEYVEYHVVPSATPAYKYKTYHTSYPVYYGTRYVPYLIREITDVKHAKSTYLKKNTSQPSDVNDRKLRHLPRFISQWRNYSKSIPLSVSLSSSPYVKSSEPFKTYSHKIHYTTNSSGIIKEYIEETPPKEEKTSTQTFGEISKNSSNSSLGLSKGSMLRTKHQPQALENDIASQAKKYTLVKLTKDSKPTSSSQVVIPSKSYNEEFAVESANVVPIKTDTSKQNSLKSGENVYLVTEKHSDKPSTMASSSSVTEEKEPTIQYIYYQNAPQPSVSDSSLDDVADKKSKITSLNDKDSTVIVDTAHTTEHQSSDNDGLVVRRKAVDVGSQDAHAQGVTDSDDQGVAIKKLPTAVKILPGETQTKVAGSSAHSIADPTEEKTIIFQQADNIKKSQPEILRDSVTLDSIDIAKQQGDEANHEQQQNSTRVVADDNNSSTLQRIARYIAHPFKNYEKDSSDQKNTVDTSVSKDMTKDDSSQLPINIPQDGDFIFYGIVFDSDTSSTLQKVKFVGEPDGRVRIGLQEGEFITNAFTLSEGSPLTTVWSNNGDEARLLSVTQNGQQGFFLQVDKYKLGIIDKRFLVYHTE